MSPPCHWHAFAWQVQEKGIRQDFDRLLKFEDKILTRFEGDTCTGDQVNTSRRLDAVMPYTELEESCAEDVGYESLQEAVEQKMLPGVRELMNLVEDAQQRKELQTVCDSVCSHLETLDKKHSELTSTHLVRHESDMDFDEQIDYYQNIENEIMGVI